MRAGVTVDRLTQAAADRADQVGFDAVSIAALLVNLVVLEALVSGSSLGDLAAQAIAVAIAMPFNFLGNKLWTFA